ncbi:hypothetical protein ACTDI4_08895 [Mesorhizobium sp. PUT5]|uniref:hypothetical protein n=1 Tax=Mesorhizobium sp. PUT5 TaxID=3454629 RepID=UPI003FA4A33F
MEELSYDELAGMVMKDVVPATIGRATIAWNNVSQSVYYIFQTLTGLDHDAAKAAFFAVSSDRSQRDMTQALIEQKLKPINPKLAKRAMAALGDVNGLAGKRNDILHVVFAATDDPKTASLFHGRGHIKDKSGSELISSVHQVAMRSLQAASALLEIASEIMRLPEFHPAPLPTPPKDIFQLGTTSAANLEGFGLLDFLATMPPSPDEEPQ